MVNITRWYVVRLMRRPDREEFYESPSSRNKRSHGKFEREPYYKDRRMDSGSRPPRYASGRRDAFINGGSYSDYMREFSQRPPPPPHPMAQFGPPPGFFDQTAYASHYDSRPSRGGYAPSMPTNDYAQERYGSKSKRSYERDVDEFLRRTSSGLSSKHRNREEPHTHRSSERGRDRERERDRDRDRERDREREYHDRRERDYDQDRYPSEREREKDRGRRRERR